MKNSEFCVGKVITSDLTPALFGKIVQLNKNNTAIIEAIDRKMNSVCMIVNLNYWH